jgi:hypothetical protein
MTPNYSSISAFFEIHYISQFFMFVQLNLCPQDNRAVVNQPMNAQSGKKLFAVRQILHKLTNKMEAWRRT